MFSLSIPREAADSSTKSFTRTVREWLSSGQDPIGQLIQFGGMDGDLRVFTIVGDVRERGLDGEPLPTLSADYRQRPLNGLLFGIKPMDPGTYVAVVFLLAFATLAACEVPAIRATRVDPAQALRAE